MKKAEYIWLRMHFHSAIELSLLEPGEEIYAFSDYWPKNPATIEIKETTEMVDLSIAKNVLTTQLKTENQNCKMYKQPRYVGKSSISTKLFG